MPLLFEVEKAPDDPILGLTTAFLADGRETKVNLGVGAYKTSEGTPLVLRSVRRAEVRMMEQRLNKEYPPMTGVPMFVDGMLRLVYGPDSEPLSANCVQGMQTVGGTGGLRIGAGFLSVIDRTHIAMPDPTWANHPAIFKAAGLSSSSYRYYDREGKKLLFAEMCDDLKQLPEGAVVLLHACCHNPTGEDPTPEQWAELSELMQEHKLIPFFDNAYQGFAEGLAEDAYAIRYFTEQGHEMLVASSCSKNFGLYGERVGMLSFVAASTNRAESMISQAKLVARALYSMPPINGARIAGTILDDASLRREWSQELGALCERIQEMRKALASKLMIHPELGEFNFINRQRGMFSMLGISREHVEQLRDSYGIYMPLSGRINLAGLNPANLDTVTSALAEVMSAT